jgi:hypothetical protein
MDQVKSEVTPYPIEKTRAIHAQFGNA